MPFMRDRLKKRRLDMGLTLEEVAQEVQVERATIQRYESGKIKRIDTLTVESLAAALKCNPAYLLGWTDTPTLVNSTNAEVDAENEAEAMHLEKYRALNAAGRKKVDEDIDDLLQIPKYQRREPSGEPSGFILNRMMSTGNWEELPTDHFEKLKEIAEAARKQSTPVKK